jgi:hypothetical protein
VAFHGRHRRNCYRNPELFNADVYAHIRRAMGLVSAKEIARFGHTLASEHIGTAIATMSRYNRIRTPYFQELLKQAREQSMNPQPTREIVRQPDNPFLRYVGGAALAAMRYGCSSSAAALQYVGLLLEPRCCGPAPLTSASFA